MSKVLLKFQSNYSDEYNVYGLTIMEKEDWIKEKDYIKSNKFIEDNGNWPYERYFGTNEHIIFETPDDLINSYKEIDLDDNEVKVIEKLKLTHFGWTPEI